jgi:hypothetical protein
MNTVKHHIRYACILCTLVCCLAAIPVVPGVLKGDEEKEAKLSFALPEGKTFHYELSMAMETNLMGMDVVQNESYKVNLKLMKVTDEGAYRVSLEFPEASSSMLVDGEMQDWSPQMQLEGKSIMADVASNGEVLEVKPGGNSPGMGKPKDLKDIAKRWFIELPDTVKRVGESWRKDVEEREEAKEGEEEKEPTLKGWHDLTFKKIGKEKGIPVAVIEAESKLEIHQRMPGGVLNGVGRGKGIYYIAIEGGYIVESKSKLEIKGTVVSGDGKETDTAITRYYETKLKK